MITRVRSTIVTGVLTAIALLVVSSAGRAELVGHWTFDDGAGSTATDSSGKGNHGNLINMESDDWITGRFGGALHFDGTNTNPHNNNVEYVQIPNSATLEDVQEGDYTLMAWFRTDVYPPGSGSDNAAQYGILEKQGNHTGLRATSAEKFAVDAWRSDGNASATSLDTFELNEWYHVASVVKRDDPDDGSVKIYVNGELQGTGTFTNDTAREYNTMPWRVGVASPTASTYRWALLGDVDDVRIYNTALTQQEIRAVVPEPSSIALLAFATLAFLAGTRRRRQS